MSNTYIIIKIVKNKHKVIGINQGEDMNGTW